MRVKTITKEYFIPDSNILYFYVKGNTLTIIFKRGDRFKIRNVLDEEIERLRTKYEYVPSVFIKGWSDTWTAPNEPVPFSDPDSTGTPLPKKNYTITAKGDNDEF